MNLVNIFKLLISSVVPLRLWIPPEASSVYRERPLVLLVAVVDRAVAICIPFEAPHHGRDEMLEISDMLAVRASNLSQELADCSISAVSLGTLMNGVVCSHAHGL